MIKAYNIKKDFENIKVIKGIDLHIAKGELVAIVGPSGAGKTTLMQIVGSLMKSDSGEVYINDVNINKLSESNLAKFRNEQIGFVFQFHHLLPEFSALENVILPALIKGESKASATYRAKEILETVGLSQRLEHKPSQMSGGEQQRVAIARALINNPSVILADEPTGNLDTKNRDELNKLFIELKQRYNQTVVIVTHDEALANLADRKIIIVDGLVKNE